MSEGSFESFIYSRSDGSLHKITAQPETAELEVDGVVNASVAGVANSDLVAQVSAGRRSIGLHARLIRLKVEDGGTSDVEVGSVLTLPWFNAATFQAATEPPGKPFTYRDGISGVVSGNSPEKYRG